MNRLGPSYDMAKDGNNIGGLLSRSMIVAISCGIALVVVIIMILTSVPQNF